MDKQLIKILIALCGVIIAGLVLLFNQTETLEPVLEYTSDTTSPASISITIADYYANSAYPITATSTVYSVLTEINRQDGAMYLQSEMYEGLGVLITAMYEQENGTNNHYWQYEVNDALPQISTDAYILEANANVIWSFAPSTY